MTTTVAVAGASGRLGKVVCQEIENHPDFELVAKLGSASAPEEGADADLLIDVTNPDASPVIVERALRRGQKVVIGTSGWPAAKIEELRALVDEVGGVAFLIPSFSFASAIAGSLVLKAAPFFDSIEIIESHHPGKVDSPSGTAVRTAERIAEVRAGRPVVTPFPEQTARGLIVEGIPVHALRQSGVIAQQEVRFGGSGETVSVRLDIVNSADAYRTGIRATLDAVVSAPQGLLIGLDRVLGIA